MKGFSTPEAIAQEAQMEAVALLMDEPEECPCDAKCFRCHTDSNLQLFDGPNCSNPRRICAQCEYTDWKATIGSLAAPQG